jgi:DNA-binding NtrC family response regulator
MIESAVIIAESAEIQARDLPVVVRGRDPQAGLDLSDNMSLEELERRYIGLLLERLGGHRAKVAKVLQISERNLYRKLRAYELADTSASGRRRTPVAGTH